MTRGYEPYVAPYIPYQVDYNSASTGKHASFTKRTVTWKFGFANLFAVASGKTGVECRGTEHEVRFTWSLASGKRHVYFDNTEIHYSHSGTNGWTEHVFQHTFHMPGKEGNFHSLHIVAHARATINATQGAQSVGKKYHQFDLMLDSKSFFDFPKMFELGNEDMKLEYATLLEALPPPPTAGWGGDLLGDDDKSRPSSSRAMVSYPSTMSTAYRSPRRDDPSRGYDTRYLPGYSSGGNYQLQQRYASHRDEIPRSQSEEMRMIEAAKAASLREFRAQNEKKNEEEKKDEKPATRDFAESVGEERKLVALAKLASLRDLREQTEGKKKEQAGQAIDEKSLSSFPSFARPPSPSQRHSHQHHHHDNKNQPHVNLAPVKEDDSSNLIDFESVRDGGDGMMTPGLNPPTVLPARPDGRVLRSTSSITIDPAISEDDGEYKIPPSQQHNMGDMFQPQQQQYHQNVPGSNESVYSTNTSNMWGWTSPIHPMANVPPPPTWEETNVAFGYAQSHHSTAGGFPTTPTASFDYGGGARDSFFYPSNVGGTSPFLALPAPSNGGGGASYSNKDGGNYYHSNNTGAGGGPINSPQQQQQQWVPTTPTGTTSSYAQPTSVNSPPKGGTQGQMMMPNAPDLAPFAASPTTAAIHFGTGGGESNNSNSSFGHPEQQQEQQQQPLKKKDSVAEAMEKLVDLTAVNLNVNDATKMSTPRQQSQRKNVSASHGLPPSRTGATWYAPDPSLEDMRQARNNSYVGGMGKSVMQHPPTALPSYAPPPPAPASQPQPQQTYFPPSGQMGYTNYSFTSQPPTTAPHPSSYGIGTNTRTGTTVKM